MAGFFTSVREKQINKVLLIPVEKILMNPAQPRKVFNQESLIELSQSIRENGLLQPLTLRKNEDETYQLIAGERRFRACQLLGHQEIPCIIVDATVQMAAILALVENLQRKDLNFFEEAMAIQMLIEEWGITQEETAQKLSRSQSAIANKLRLLKIPAEEQRFIEENQLTERHARSLLKIESSKTRWDILHKIVDNQWTVSKTEAYIEEILNPPKEQQPMIGGRKIVVVRDVRLFVNSISKAVETMKLSGIPAQSEINEQEDCLEYIVRIPKTSAYKKRMA